MGSPEYTEDKTDLELESDTHRVLGMFCDKSRKPDGITREDVRQAMQAAASSPTQERYVIVTGGVCTGWGDNEAYMRAKFSAFDQTGLWSWGVLVERKNGSE